MQSYTKASLVCSGMFPESWMRPRWPEPSRRTWSRSHQRRMPGWMRPPGCPHLLPRPVRLVRRKTLPPAQGRATSVCCPSRSTNASQQVVGWNALGSGNLRVSLDLKLETSGFQRMGLKHTTTSWQRAEVQPAAVVRNVWLLVQTLCRRSRSLSPLRELNRSQQLQQRLLSAESGALVQPCHTKTTSQLGINFPPVAHTTPCRKAVLWLDEIFWLTSRDRALNLILSSHVQRLLNDRPYTATDVWWWRVYMPIRQLQQHAWIFNLETTKNINGLNLNFKTRQ